ncbi:Partner of Y14 and mago, partial [Stegodyphus mimosarum]
MKKIPGLSETVSETVPKSKKKKKKKSDSQKVDNVCNQMENLDISSKALNNASNVTPSNPTKGSQPITTDPAKRIRNLKKKLRDINALKQKIESGELANPEKDQLEKIAR